MRNNLNHHGYIFTDQNINFYRNDWSYFYYQNNLNSCLRSDWIKVRDLDYVETDIIANIERFIPELAGFLVELQVRAVGLAAAQAAVEEAKKSGTLGVAKVEKKSVTKPISPRINQLTVPRIPEPERVENHFKANYLIPNSLNQNNLEMVQKHRDDVREKEREKLKKKYDNSHNL